MGPASAYATVLNAIDSEVEGLMASYPHIFTFDSINQGVCQIRDFQTTGVVSHARGCPFFALRAGRVDVCGQRVTVKEEYRQNCARAIYDVVGKSLLVAPALPHPC